MFRVQFSVNELFILNFCEIKIPAKKLQGFFYKSFCKCGVKPDAATEPKATAAVEEAAPKAEKATKKPAAKKTTKAATEPKAKATAAKKTVAVKRRATGK